MGTRTVSVVFFCMWKAGVALSKSLCVPRNSLSSFLPQKNPEKVCIRISLTAGQGDAATVKSHLVSNSSPFSWLAGTPLMACSLLAGHCHLHTIAGNGGLINCSSKMPTNVWVGCVGQQIICGEIHKTSGICKCFHDDLALLQTLPSTDKHEP